MTGPVPGTAEVHAAQRVGPAAPGMFPDGRA
jgi:hypothetical protein